MNPSSGDVPLKVCKAVWKTPMDFDTHIWKLVELVCHLVRPDQDLEMFPIVAETPSYNSDFEHVNFFQAVYDVTLNNADLTCTHASHILMMLAIAFTSSPQGTAAIMHRFNSTRRRNVDMIELDSAAVFSVNTFHLCAPGILTTVFEQNDIDIKKQAHQFVHDSSMLWSVIKLWVDCHAGELGGAKDMCLDILSASDQ
ncbi:hypothetical protein BDK51DRAFT_28811, partial [Blyttiomyces helicus]